MDERVRLEMSSKIEASERQKLMDIWGIYNVYPSFQVSVSALICPTCIWIWYLPQIECSSQIAMPCNVRGRISISFPF